MSTPAGLASAAIDARWVYVGLLIVLAGVVAAMAGRWSPPIWVAVLVGFLFRAAMVALAFGKTPLDAALVFHRAGEAVLAGADPLVVLPRFAWNFLPLMPYWWALVVKSRLPWELAVKALPVAADLVNVALVARLAPTAPRACALQYAANPVAILVAAWHGQVEPIALALGLYALVSARSNRDALAGGLIGVAASVKTWPAIFLAGVLCDAAKRARVLLAAAAVPLLVLATMPLFIHADLRQDVRILAGYRSMVGTWGWSAMARYLYSDPNSDDVLGYAGAVVDKEARIGTAVTALALLGVIWLWRRAGGLVVMQAALLAFLAVTPGFGVQYLMWPVPLLAARPTWRSHLFVALATMYLAVFYVPSPVREHAQFIVLSLPIIAAAVLAMPWELARAEPPQGDPRPHSAG